MNTLLVDIGNTRAKWRLLEDPSQHGVFVDQLPSLGHCFTGLNISRVVCASVRSDVVNERFSKACVKAFAREPEFVQVQQTFAGLRQGYGDASALGVDRWLAMVAAYKRRPESLIVVDAGTAVTIDVIRHDGQHLGGYIVPGLQVLVDSLNNGTGLIDVKTLRLEEIGLGCSTAQAVVAGCARMIVSLVAQIKGDYPNAGLIVTGGGGLSLLPYLQGDVTHVPDLVFEGIALVARAIGTQDQ